MRFTHLILVLCLVNLGIILIGCKDQPKVGAIVNVSQSEDVGVFHGRHLKRMTIENSMTSDHYVYFFDDAGTQPVTVNYQAGKSHQVVVFIDGVPTSTNYVGDPLER